MEKRSSDRKYTRLEVRLISRSLNYKGTMVNMAANGICISINTEKNECQINEGMLFVVKFNSPAGEEIGLQCKVLRTHENLNGDLEKIAALEIINQSDEYQKYLNSRS